MKTDNGWPKPFDAEAARKRCVQYRRRILDLSQKVPALHIAPAFSCLELVDCIYYGLMRRKPDGLFWDTFILSKGHGSLAQYAVLEELGIISKEEMEKADQPGGHYGGHPDYGLPGIEASTGSLGHGLPMAAGMVLADKTLGEDRKVFIIISDGELQEGSVWETILLAPTLGLTGLTVFVDLNDFQSLGRISEIHPNFFPIASKVAGFGWQVAEIDGHDPKAIFAAVAGRNGKAPLMIFGRTIKGKGVSYMENVPIWHYRSPSPDEYQIAIKELAGASK